MALVAKTYCDPPERQAMNIVVGAVKRIYNPSPLTVARRVRCLLMDYATSRECVDDYVKEDQPQTLDRRLRP
jgi:hypothetical protein